LITAYTEFVWLLSNVLCVMLGESRRNLTCDYIAVNYPADLRFIQ